MGYRIQPSVGEVVASGAFDGVYIYNGLEWKSLQGVVSQDETTYTGIFLINETIFCAGSNDSRAKIIIGKQLNRRRTIMKLLNKLLILLIISINCAFGYQGELRFLLMMTIQVIIKSLPIVMI